MLRSDTAAAAADNRNDAYCGFYSLYILRFCWSACCSYSAAAPTERQKRDFALLCWPPSGWAGESAAAARVAAGVWLAAAAGGQRRWAAGRAEQQLVQQRQQGSSDDKPMGGQHYL